jgi:hypothetical protein
MCVYFSCLALRDGTIAWCESDSHEDIITWKGLKDDKLNNRDFVRLEVLNGDISKYMVDEGGTLPEWYGSGRYYIDLVKVALPTVKGKRAEYEKIRGAALAEYEKIKRPAWAEYAKIERPAWAEYEKIERPAWAEYKKIQGRARNKCFGGE